MNIFANLLHIEGAAFCIIITMNMNCKQQQKLRLAVNEENVN